MFVLNSDTSSGESSGYETEELAAAMPEHYEKVDTAYFEELLKGTQKKYERSRRDSLISKVNS